MEKGYWFTSDLFQIEKGEDQETNPGYYGKQLGHWLCEKFKKIGYGVEEPIPEDWGWCVMCSREEYQLWIGCGAMLSEEYPEDYDFNIPPAGQDVIWHVFPVIEVPFFNLRSRFKKWTGRLDTQSPLKKLNVDLQAILGSEPRIILCEEP